MLAKIAEGSSVPHRITYVIAQGKNIGQVREKAVYYGAPTPRNSRTFSGGNGKRTFVRGGLLPFTDFETGRMETLFTFNIIKFNGKEVRC
jgi:hypothetical protein